MKNNFDFLHILIIEDNPGDVMLIEDYLEDFFKNIEIDVAKNFKEGEQLLNDSPRDYSAILLDLSLPDKKEEELVKEIVAICGSAPLIILTGHVDMPFSIKTLSLGASDYLLKEDLNSLALCKSILYNIERHKHVKELQESQIRYNDLFHLSPQPMLVFDLENLGIIDINFTATQHYGYSYEEFTSKTIKDIRPPSDLDKLYYNLNDSKIAKNKNKQGFRGVFNHLKKNGDIIQVEIYGNDLVVNGRKVRLVLSNDITDRIKYISAIETQNEKLKEISWIQSHIVRAPLARMMGIIDLLKDKEDDDLVDQKDFLMNELLSSASELDMIIRDISLKAEKV